MTDPRGEALQPCPFCGSSLLAADLVPNTGGNRRFIRCLACHAHGPWSTLAINEADGWSGRAPLSATAPLPANARAVALEEAAQICEKLLHGQKPALGAFVPPEQHCAGAIRAAATLPEAPQPATAASDALRRLSEDVMRCIDASWKPGYARDYGNLGPILAEYIDDLRRQALPAAFNAPDGWHPDEPNAPLPATPATASSALQEAVNIGLAALGYYNTEQTDAHWNEQEKRLRALALSETGWIKCSERLPDIGERVLVSWVNSEGTRKVGERVRLIPYEGAREFFWTYWNSRDGLLVQEAVTDWMPLPAAPSPDGNNGSAT